jgi:hypothetical protein
MYEMLQSDLASRVEERGKGYLKKLTDVVLTKLRFVQILMSDDENPHQVFDRLNNSGERLEIIDLVRNAVFQKLGSNARKQEAFYNSSWSRFEETLGDRIDTYFFPFALIHKPSTTQAEVFGDLKTRWKKQTTDEILHDLEHFVPDFRAIASGAPPPGSKEYRRAIDRLYRMPVPTSTYPFLMKLINAVRVDQYSQQDATNVMWLIESFLVRRAFAGFEPTGLHALFKNLWHETTGNQAQILKVIDDNPTISFPADDVFVDDIKTSKLYRRRLAKYVLIEYETGILGGDPIPRDIKAHTKGVAPLAAVTTIDHVMPQDPTPEWLAVVPIEVHERLLDTWANLVPLTIQFNSSKQGKSWDKVRKVFETESIYKTPKKLAKLPVWDEGALNERAATLAEWALARWPRNPK